MVLSNAERQARFQKKLRERLSSGVTPDMIVRAVKIVFFKSAEDDPSLPAWEEWLKTAHAKRGSGMWRDAVENLRWCRTPDDVQEYSQADAELLLRVGAVVRAASEPPNAATE